MFRLSKFWQAVANLSLSRRDPPTRSQPATQSNAVEQRELDPIQKLTPMRDAGWGSNSFEEFVSVLPRPDDSQIAEFVAPALGFVGDSAIVGDADLSENSSSLKGNMSFSTIPQVLQSWYMSQSFIGYQACAIIAQHWLVDKACRVAAEDAVRNGYEISVSDGTEVDSKTFDKIKKLDKKFKVLKACEDAYFWSQVFGIRVVLFEVKSSDPKYYEKPFNPDGVTKNSYKGISQIDPYWMSPLLSSEDSFNPASKTFYSPEYWVIGGKKYHRSHLIVIMGPEPADILKPSYLYGGIPLTQRIYERVYNAERTANEAPLLAMNKRTTAIHVDLKSMASNMKGFMERLASWVAFRDNHSVKVLGKEETMDQFDTSLADLDAVIMNQHQLVAAIAGVPATKLLETSPKGMDATGEFEAKQYDTRCESIQNNDMSPIVERHHLLLCRSEGFDFELDHKWNPVGTQTAKEIAEQNKLKSDMGVALINAGVISPDEERQRIRDDKTSGYNSLADEDLADVPDPSVELVNTERLKAEGVGQEPAMGGDPATDDEGLAALASQLEQALSASGNAESAVLAPNTSALVARLKAFLSAVEAESAESMRAGVQPTAARSIQPTVSPSVVGIRGRAKRVPEEEQSELTTMFGVARIENPKGSVRTGLDEEGRTWNSTMAAHYGYLRDTVGADGEGLDVFINEPSAGQNVYVINQSNPATHEFDEHKCMIGFADAMSAEQAYRDSFSADWTGFDSIYQLTPQQFQRWIKSGNLSQPFGM